MKQILCDIADSLTATGFFNQVFEYVELRQRKDGYIKPMYNKGLKAGFIDVQDWDKQGVAYIRKRSDISVALDTNQVKITSCDADRYRYVRMLLPLRLVVSVPKNTLEDSPFADDILASDLIGVIQRDMPVTAETISATKIVATVTGYSTNPMNIWSDENKGVSFDANKVYRFSYIAIDFNVEVYGSVECLQNCLRDPYLP